jgi:hypothetical protein
MLAGRSAPALLALFWGGCAGPAIDVPSREGASWSVEVEPSSAQGALGLSFRARVVGAPAAGAPWLLRGELSAAYERAVRRGDVSQALAERAVPLRYWRDGSDCLVQPLAWLVAGESYSLAWQGAGTLWRIQAEEAALPVATPLFPPPGRAKQRVEVMCDLPEPEAIESSMLEPGAVPLRPLPELEGLPRPGCVTLVAAAELEAPAVAPPLLGGALLDPAPWLPRPSAQPAPAELRPVCRGQRLGGACLEPEDDRVVITPEGEDELWLVQQPARAVVAAVDGKRQLLLSGLEPQTGLELDAFVLSASGGFERVAVALETAAARRHVVLNEVLANPLGAENSSEWIELWNDSHARAWLGDLWLVDAGGPVALPDVELEPGELALLVSRAFRPSGLDVAVPESVRLVRLPSLGTRGLANSGEALLLVGPEGTLSRFPLLASKTAGHSVARRAAAAADDDPDAFAEHGPPGASPGATNFFD